MRVDDFLFPQHFGKQRKKVEKMKRALGMPPKAILKLAGKKDVSLRVYTANKGTVSEPVGTFHTGS